MSNKIIHLIKSKIKIKIDKCPRRQAPHKTKKILHERWSFIASGLEINIAIIKISFAFHLFIKIKTFLIYIMEFESHSLLANLRLSLNIGSHLFYSIDEKNTNIVTVDYCSMTGWNNHGSFFKIKNQNTKEKLEHLV